MFLKLFSIGSAAAIASVATFLALQTVGYANSGTTTGTEQADESRNPAGASVQIDLPAGWSKIPAAHSDGALYALRCDAKGCIPGVIATLSCVPAAGSHQGTARELLTLARERPVVRSGREAVTSILRFLPSMAVSSTSAARSLITAAMS